MKICLSLMVASVAGAPSNIFDATLRLDPTSWNRALFGPYNPDDMESEPLQHILLESKDLGFAIAPLDKKTAADKALRFISKHYDEEDVVYQLDFEANGFNTTEKFVILQEGLTKCNLVKKRQLAPASPPDNVRMPPMRMLQDEGATEAAEDNAMGAIQKEGEVDLMFISANQVILTDSDFDGSPPVAHDQNNLVFAIRGRFVQKCRCSHSHLEDTWLGLGDFKFAVRKLHLKCPNPTGYKQLPLNAVTPGSPSSASVEL